MQIGGQKMFDKKKEYALVLGGGGAKGAYEIGAWKALKELGIKFNAIIGNSVGSLNGALIAQGDYRKAQKLWETTTIEKVIDIPPELVKNGRFYLDSKNFGVLKKLQQMIFKNLGLDTNPLRNLIKKNINENKIRKKGIDFGLLTFQLNDFKPLEIFIEDIPQGMLGDYLLASASLPGFKSTEINGKKFVDGGVYDNIPYDMAKRRGYKRIIVIDISGIGVNRNEDISGTNTIYIKNSLDIGSVLDFNPEIAKQLMNLGYLDTMKVFNKNYGVKYFYNYNERIMKKLDNLLMQDDIKKEYLKYLKLKKTNIDWKIIKNEIYNILPYEYKNYKYISLALAECGALSLNIERNKLYNLEDFINTIWLKHNELDKKVTLITDRKISIFELLANKFCNINFAKNIIQIFNKAAREYEKYLEIIFDKSDLHSKALNNFFPHLMGANIFFVLLKKYFKQ